MRRSPWGSRYTRNGAPVRSAARTARRSGGERSPGLTRPVIRPVRRARHRKRPSAVAGPARDGAFHPGDGLLGRPRGGEPRADRHRRRGDDVGGRRAGGEWAAPGRVAPVDTAAARPGERGSCPRPPRRGGRRPPALRPWRCGVPVSAGGSRAPASAWRRRAWLGVLACAWDVCGVAAAAPGDLDTRFGTGIGRPTGFRLRSILRTRGRQLRST